jgi:hypothetical protein
VHQGGCFLLGERQVLGPDLGDLPGCAEALQSQCGQQPADEDDAQWRRWMPEQVAHLPQDLRVVDLVEVVEDQDRLIR